MESLNRTSGVGFAVAAVATLSGVDALAKSLGAEMSSFQVAFLRYTVSALFLTLFVAVFVRRRPKPGFMKDHALKGFLAAATASLFFYGIAGMPLVMALALAMTAPIYMALLGALVFGERPGRGTYLALVLAVSGSALIVAARGTGLAGPPVSLAAIAAGLAAPLAYAFTAIAMKRSSANDHPITLSLMQTAFAALFSAPLAFVLWEAPEPALSWQIGLIGLCGALGFVFLVEGLRRMPASLYAVVDYSSLVWAGFYGFVFFDEIPTWPTLVGGALIVAACVISAGTSRGAGDLIRPDG
ncbi:DMT family transporter [Martelella radicis]|uniref:Drug/metabolite transporter (DMT)-like permease n=1 Tax=Martelella radicis TaxID=1397476 RepID=A0A7W6KGW3_9HYPH|nr:DMT family transporter [Martelella radicis]MBB4121056.1 drug/metabolite transporter (DMT)-like permease [Martelella radicis]